MTDNTQELDDILQMFKNELVWPNIEKQYEHLGAMDLDEAKQAILDWHNKQIDEATDSLIEMVSEIEFKAGINHVTMGGEWVHMDEVNKQVEAVLDRLLREYELDIKSKWFSSSGGMVDLASAIEAEINKLKESK